MKSNYAIVSLKLRLGNIIRYIVTWKREKILDKTRFLKFNNHYNLRFILCKEQNIGNIIIHM